MKAVLLVGHGSRDAAWRQPMDAVVQRMAARGVRATCAFLELQQPDLAAATAQLAAEGATQITLVPLFLGMGKHVREDLPLRVEELRRAHPGLAIHLRESVGEDPRLLDLLAQLASQ